MSLSLSKKYFLTRFFTIISVITASISIPASVYAISEAQRQMFAQNNILFYEPGNTNCLKSSSAVAFSGNELTWSQLNAISSNSSAANERLKLIVKTYGPLTMELQREYGVPWEFVFAVMIQESQVGIKEDPSLSLTAERQGLFNMIGSSLSNGPNHYSSSTVKYSDREWGGYSTISDMILGFTIYHVRSGHVSNGYNYDNGLKQLSPSNYNLEEFLKQALMNYAPPEDDNNTEDYIKNVKRRMDGTDTDGWTAIADVRKEQGWPTSEELAKQENIQPGGRASATFGWGDIREKVYETYKASGLPSSSSLYSFTSYQTSTSGGKTLSAQTGSVVLHAPTNAWLDNSGIEGFTINKALNSTSGSKHIDTSAMVAGTDTYTTFASDAGNGSGLPGSIILHWTAADNFNGSYTTFCGGDRDFYCPPHFTIDAVQKKTWQHFPLSSPSAAVSTGDSGDVWDQYAIQIEIVGHGGSPNCMSGACSSKYSIYNFTQAEWDYIAKLLIAISNETGIPLQSNLKWDENMSNRTILTASEMKSYIGVMGHLSVEGSQNAHNKTDPGKAWDYLVTAIPNAGYSYSSSNYSSQCTSFAHSGTCFSLPEADGGCTTDNNTYYWQGSASWSSTTTVGNCTIGGSGCGFAATAMVLTALTGTQVTPTDALRAGKSSGSGLVESNGTWSCNGLWTMPEAIIRGGNYAVNYTYRSAVPSINAINAILNRGGMVITTVSSNKVKYKKSPTDSWSIGQLTGGGHFIAIRGKLDDSTWQIFTSSRSPDSNANNYYYEASSVVGAMRQWYGEAYAK